MNDNEKARQIINDIIYITLATVSADGRPWVSPVYSAFDSGYDLYWVSPVGALHSQNIRNNGRVAIVIYDSTVPEGTGEGVYINARVSELSDEDDIRHAIALLYDRKHKPHRTVADFLGESPRRIYKAVPEEVWMNGMCEVSGQTCDVRIEIDLKKK